MEGWITYKSFSSSNAGLATDRLPNLQIQKSLWLFLFMCDKPRKLTHSEAGKLGAIASKNITNWLKRQEQIVKYYSNPKKCSCCGKAIVYSLRTVNKYCSRSCAAISNNKRRNKTKRNTALPKANITHTYQISRCLFCGRELRGLRKYCSLICMQKHRQLLAVSEIQANKMVSASRLRRFLIKKHSKCMNLHCRWNWKSEQNPILEIHHLDGDPNNNVLSNVVLLCPNCHSLTDTYKAKNIGKGRAFRRKRYKEGKSY